MAAQAFEQDTVIKSVQVIEIIETLNGESSSAGRPCILLRLSGCPLRCRYCDTQYAYSGGEQMSLDVVLQALAAYPHRRVLLTGGEPLGQKHSLALIDALLDAGYEIWLETSGAVDISRVPPAVHKVMDYKAPSSGMAGRMLDSNLQYLHTGDDIKFIVADRADFDAALHVIEQHDLTQKCQVLVGPVHGELSALELSRWLLQTGLDLRLNVQLHKLLFGGDGDRAL